MKKTGTCENSGRWLGRMGCESGRTRWLHGTMWNHRWSDTFTYCMHRRERHYTVAMAGTVCGTPLIPR